MLLPLVCPACRSVGRAPCLPCIDRMRPAVALPPPAGVDSCFAALDYDGAGRELVARLKYRNARASLGWLADQVAAAVRAGGGPPPDAVTWAPTTPERRRQRGFDQAELLARALARRLGVRCRRLLARGRGPAQTGRGRGARASGPTFVAVRLPPPCVLVVDDVVTTGATATAAALALRAAGSSRVLVAAAARTRPGRSHPPARA